MNEKITGPHVNIAGLRVLIVEDDALTLNVMRNYLERQGLEVMTANNGKLGLELFRQNRPQIVISDIRMPEMDGISMCRAIREIDAETHIILTTAHNESELLMEAIDLGAVKYVLKPVDPLALIRTIELIASLIDKKRILESRLQTMGAFINAAEYEAEKLQSYVRRTMEIDRQKEYPCVRNLYIPMGDVSGDFFCVENFGDTIYAIVADGTGHGASAVLPALQVPHIFRKQVHQGFSLLTIADVINRSLHDKNLAEHFLAATLVRLNYREGFIEVLNCGNPDALLLNQEGRLLQQFGSNSFALGMVNVDDFDADIQRYEYTQPASLYVFTDGLPDTLNHTHTLGFDLTQVFAQLEPAALFDQLVARVNAITAQKKFDDLTLLEIRFAAGKTQPQAMLPPLSGASKQPLPAASSMTEEARLKKMSVLFVEDDDDTFEYMSRYLHRRVGILHTARDGAEGLQKFTEHRPQLVISDISMPILSGFSMAQAIRSIDEDVPIILISAAMEAESVENMLDMNVTKFLLKPIDINRLRQALVESVNRFDKTFDIKLSASVFMNTPLAISITSMGRDIIAVNPAFCSITGYAEDEVLGRNPRILSSGKHDDVFYQKMWASINTTGNWSGELWNRRKNGELFLEWITISAVKNASGEVIHYVSIFADITERNAADAKIRHLAQHDSLTNLPNRVLFMDRVNQTLLQARREKESVAIMMLDVDHFKTINDTLGYSAGDGLLCTLAATLLDCVRATDTVCRLGADGFAILLSNAGSREMIERLASKIIGAVNISRPVSGMDLQVGISIGISIYPADGDDAETLVKHAESALHAAKQGGRNHYRFFDATQSDQGKRLLAIQQGMRSGLIKNEFSMVYQPKYSQSKKCIVGAEALIRWSSPTLGNVSPVEFIPVAEETGFIVNIGEWVIATVFKQVAAWKSQGIPLVPIAINISPRHFQRGQVIPALLQALKYNGLGAELFQIELTEGVVMNDSETTMRNLLELRKHGFKISIDDFGTGYSSLSYLRRLPIDELKIDRAFVMEISDALDAKDLLSVTAIPLSIIQLAKNLNFTVVAEGVETEAQQAFLARNGCDVIQGYLFSKPVPPEAFAALLQ